MAKFPEASARLFHNVFVCKRCKTKRKADIRKILDKQILCRKCGSKAFRAIKSKK
ncbi:50S ribosomal protein L40e [Candidatus Woesearchaeota archaeon]|nr:50S ribosomal protein L40e [Candidatus Woesearchaeota archaeon]